MKTVWSNILRLSLKTSEKMNSHWDVQFTFIWFEGYLIVEVINFHLPSIYLLTLECKVDKEGSKATNQISDRHPEREYFARLSDHSYKNKPAA